MRLFHRQRLRTLFFFHETTWSGAPIQLFHLLVWLHGKGWPVAAAVPEVNTAEAGPLTNCLTSLGIEALQVINLTSPPNLSALGTLCDRFDVIIANTLVMWAAVRAAHESKVACVWYVHESLVARELIELNPEIADTLCLPEFLVMPTQRTASLYQSYLTRPVTVVPYGIPPLRPGPVTGGSIHPKILLLGSYEARKGQDVFVNAIRELPEPLRVTSCFRMAGREIEPEYVAGLKRKAADLANVEFGPALDHEEACAAVAAADIVVCASRDETMPLVLLEAMSLGKAIITTDVGGIGEWLHDGISALLVRPDDSTGLARALQRCLRDSQLRTQMGRAARRTFRRHFSLDQLGETFRGLLRQAYSKRNP